MKYILTKVTTKKFRSKTNF